MKELTSEFNSIIPNHGEIENTLTETFPNYRVSYNVFADIWKIENKSYKHSIWYRKDSKSKLVTKRHFQHKEIIVINALLLLLFALFAFANYQLEWEIDTFFSFIGWVILIALVDMLIFQFKPKLKQDVKDEHQNVLNMISNLNS